MKTTLSLSALLLAAALFASNKTFAQQADATASTPSLMMSFSGAAQGDVADLNWVMENETNSKWFVVERAGAEGGFDSIAVVMGINDANMTTYTFSDPDMLPGTNSYRLREVDMTGVQRYSKVIMLQNAQVSVVKMAIYPNPAVATINYTVNSAAAEPVLVQVYSITGVAMLNTQQEVQEGSNVQSVAINNLKAGNYILKVSSQTGSFSFVEPFVKID
ncbi:MAG TPA: T9SS type A sorting domain-containing protein [Puia sp.]|nr:T9SS type A sorting domain-containing protein [Puia sp.]